MKTVNYVLAIPLNKNYKIVIPADIHSKVNPHILPAFQSNGPDMICIAKRNIWKKLRASTEI